MIVSAVLQVIAVLLLCIAAYDLYAVCVSNRSTTNVKRNVHFVADGSQFMFNELYVAIVSSCR
jgi:hypothetical protein